MAKTTRVHLLAKELGVKSKSIVEKCQAEGLDIKNHMSTISIGLAATIREWFSEGTHATTVETTKRVDLTKVRVKRKRARKTAEEGVPVEAETTAQVPAVEPEEAAQAVAVAQAPEPVAAEEPVAKPEAAKVEVKKPKKLKRAKPLIIKTKPVIPAGPKLEKPKPAKLSGPQVIRVEKVEPVEPKRPKRRASKPKYDAPISEPLMIPEKARPGGEKPKKGGKDRTHGRRKERSVSGHNGSHLGHH